MCVQCEALYRFAFFCVVCVHAAVVRSVCLLWNAAVNEPLCPHCMVQQPTCAHTHTLSLTHILFILTQTRLFGEFTYESRFCSPGTVRLSYISQCPVPSIHPPNFSAYPIQGHGGPVIEQEPEYTLGGSPVCHMANA